jgi:hypothetical protein
MCADLCQTGFCLSIIENRNFPESSIYLASKGVFSFICLSAGSRKDRFNSASSSVGIPAKGNGHLTKHE